MSLKESALSLVERLKASGIGQFVEKYTQDRAEDHAALIAFSALFSIFPLIGALLTLLGIVISDEATFNNLVTAINQLFPTELAGMLGFLQETRQITGLLGLVSFIGLLWSASNLFGRMSRAFNHFYGVEDRGWIGQRLTAFVMIFVFLGLILVSVVASSAATLLVGVSEELLPIPTPNLGLVESVLGWAISIGSAILLFLAVYRVVPNAPLSIGKVWKGSLLAAALFVLIVQLFPLYLQIFGGGFAAYKTIGLFLLLMTWFYFLARILVLGAEVNAFCSPLPGQTRVSEQPLASGAAPPINAEHRRHRGFTRRLLRVGALVGAVLLIVQRLRRHG